MGSAGRGSTQRVCKLPLLHYHARIEAQSGTCTLSGTISPSAREPEGLLMLWLWLEIIPLSLILMTHSTSYPLKVYTSLPLGEGVFRAGALPSPYLNRQVIFLSCSPTSSLWVSGSIPGREGTQFRVYLTQKGQGAAGMGGKWGKFPNCRRRKRCADVMALCLERNLKYK